ncbi:MAG: hypothetical protein R3220_09500 [Balneolaceae bacterium]|nr:hypothetical protein [Balneolaceae bacterium]
MKYIYAIAAGLVSVIVAAFSSAIVLGIFNLYLTGHGITWPSEPFTWYFISISLLDCIMLAITFTAMIGAFLIIIKHHNRSVNVK